MTETNPNGPAASTNTGDSAPPFRYGAALANQIEAKWQDHWERERTFAAPNPGEPGFDASRAKQFILDMFPYPSGVGLHVGHPLGFIATDIYARFLRMTGHNVLHAMGYDAFGLPAEQYAVQTNTHPRVTTEKNIATMRRQMRRLGLAHDPRRSVSTTDTEFYRWTQWIFLQIYNSWYDGRADAPGGTGVPPVGEPPRARQGRARPISELIAEFESGKRPTSTTKAWAKMTDAERRAEVDAHRLAYLTEVPVNWCPGLGTVLANEEVIDGKSERGNFPVYRRPLKQWMMRITAYADRLLEDLEPLAWPEAIKAMQRNWIGRSEGAFVDFECAKRRIRVFTTRPDTLFGATYMVLSPEHPMVDAIVPGKVAGASPSGPAVPAGPGSSVPEKTESGGDRRSTQTLRAFKHGVFPGADELFARGATFAELVAAYRAYAKDKSDVSRQEGKDKTGVFTGAYAVNPVNGERVPVFLADYVLMGYGTGAIMAVPAHDERDFEFAETFGVPMRVVVKPESGEAKEGCFSGEGIAVNSGPLNGLSTADAKAKVVARLEELGLGAGTTTYKLRDWLFSRQRYWGEPFPIVFDEDGVPHDLPESMLPVLLPHMENFKPSSSDDPNAPVVTPLGRAEDWVKVNLDLGDGRGERAFTRETNTMPNWAGSCWYYLRYLDPANPAALVGKDTERFWMLSSRTPGMSPRIPGSPASASASFDPSLHHLGGVDLYVGGVEHAVLHLLYARFWHKVLFDLGHVSTPEPFGRLFNQGYIQAAAYTDARGAYVEAAEVEERDGAFFHNGQPVTRAFGKMGKSLKNAVSPDEVCAQYGCDTLRVYEMSMGPLEASKPWNTRDIAGAHRFLQRVWRNLVDEQTGETRVTDAAADAGLTRLLHKTIMAVRHDLKTLGFNTAVAKLIEFNNELTRLHGPETKNPVPRRVAEPLTLMLAPLAPHAAEELWARLGHPGTLAYQAFPVADEALAADDQVEIAVQVLGKLRGKVIVPAGADAKAIEAAALADESIRKHTEGKAIKKVIVVPGKLVNIVVG